MSLLLQLTFESFSDNIFPGVPILSDISSSFSVVGICGFNVALNFLAKNFSIISFFPVVSVTNFLFSSNVSIPHFLTLLPPTKFQNSFCDFGPLALNSALVFLFICI